MTRTLRQYRQRTHPMSPPSIPEKPPAHTKSPRLLSAFVILIAATSFKILLIHSYRSTDFEVHRNWLAVTHSLPLTQWYKEKTSEWTLDYPPFFAWFEKLLAVFASYFDPGMLIVSNLNYASDTTVRFQRLSVIITEFILIKAVMMFIAKEKRANKEWTADQFAIFALTVSNAGLIIVDHIHFQYNGFLLGILVLSMYFIATGKDLVGGIVYAILINFKHIYAYAAPLYFVYLLRHYCFVKLPNSDSRRFMLKNFAVLGCAVTTVFLVSLGPFIWHGQLFIVLARLFPVKRGLTHAYWAPNFWAMYNALDRVLIVVLGRRGANNKSLTRGAIGDVEHVILGHVTPSIALIVSLLAMAPVLISVWRRPYKDVFASALCYVMMTSFMFGWHVHEKAILMVTIPLCLIARRSPIHTETFLFMNLIANYSLIPLLFRAEEAYIRICLVFAHSAFSYILLGSALQWNKYAWKHVFYLVYVFGLLAIQSLMFLQPIFSLKMEFLPLLLTSVYCSAGMIICMVKLLQIHYIDSLNTSNKID